MSSIGVIGLSETGGPDLVDGAGNYAHGGRMMDTLVGDRSPEPVSDRMDVVTHGNSAMEDGFDSEVHTIINLIEGKDYDVYGGRSLGPIAGNSVLKPMTSRLDGDMQDVSAVTSGINSVGSLIPSREHNLVPKSDKQYEVMAGKGCLYE